MKIKKEYITTYAFDNFIYWLLEDETLYRQYRFLALDNNYLYELYTSSEDEEDFRNRLIEVIKEYSK